MSAHDDHFDEFGDHTGLKHLILTSYLRSWVRVVLGQRNHDHAWFVDAFAGRGNDDAGKPGSPLIACDVAREFEGDFGKAKDGTPPLQIVAIEKHRPTYMKLLEAAKRGCDDGYVTVLQGTLEDHLEDTLRLGAFGDPRLFFLDPFGVKGLRASDLQRILSFERAEALLLFNDTGANRLHGAATKRRADAAPDAAVNLFGESDDSGSVDLGPRRIAAEATAPAAEGILRDAFGDEAYERAANAVTAKPPRERPREWINQYVATMKEFGATFVLPFSVCDREGTHRYYLVHASTHRRAILKMKEAIHTAKKLHDSGTTQGALFYQTTVDIAQTVAAIRTRFAGRTVRWVDGNVADTIKMFLVEETNALLSDMDAIKDEMTAAGWQVSKRPLIFAVPPLT